MELQPSPGPGAERASISRFVPVAALTATMWISEIVDTALGGDLDRFGIRPRELGGLDGVVLAPVLHGGFGHLIANTLPFLIMGAVIAIGGMARYLGVTAVIVILGGAGTWLLGPDNTIHIGASGVVFGYLTYLLSRGFFARSVGYLLAGVLTFAVYGGVLWGLLPRPGISWQGHLFGALAGVAAAWFVHGDREDAAASSTM